MVKVSFSKDQLYEIEKRFDILAGEIQMFFNISLSKLDLLKDEKKKQEIISKVMDECVKGHDMYRTISAICQKERLNMR